MKLIRKIEAYYLQAKANRWFWLFSLFCRILLAYAFIVAGITKIVGERFASGLAITHPMGAYLEALHHTGYYYEFIGYVQVLAAILLLIPRTVLLGALIYFPIILNIWILSYAVRFEGSIVTSPLMTFAVLFLICWNYDRVRYLLPFKDYSEMGLVKKPEKYSWKFPYFFFTGVVATVILVITFAIYGHDVMPRNSLKDCKKQFIQTENEAAGFAFCECIHIKGRLLNECLQDFKELKESL